MAGNKSRLTGTTDSYKPSKARAKIYLYQDIPHRSLDLKKIKDYLDDLNIESELKGDFYKAGVVSFEYAAKRLASTRIIDLRREGALNFHPSTDDIKAESAILTKNEPVKLERDLSNVYDAFSLSDFMKSSVGGGLHIVFTSRMFATYEGSRYHGRVIFMDFPLAIISTTGLVEAPAKPADYYVRLAAFNSAKAAGYDLPDISSYEAEIREELKGSFIDYNDPLLTEVVKGYVLQVIFYFLFGEGFCPDENCILYNAHTQEELIHAQLTSGVLCGSHRKLL